MSSDKVQSTLEQRLSPAHLAMLRAESAIADDVILARGYRTVTNKDELLKLGFAAAQCLPGLLLPLWPPDAASGPDGAPRPGGGNGLYVLRPDAPRSFDQKDKPRLPDGTYPQRVLKYEFPKGEKMRLDCPPPCRPRLGNPAVPLWITEGQKKADALASQGFCALALLGVWNWRGRNDLGGLTALADWDAVALKGRDVRIVFDSDVTRRPAVQNALKRLTAFLKNRGARVTVIYLPHGEHGRKQGVDDFLAAGHTAADLEALVEAPRPQPQPAAATVELLDAEPGILKRPLMLLDDRAYAATWLHARITKTETVNRAGEIIRLDPPEVTTETRLFVVRDDSTIFGDGGDAPLDALGAEVRLPEMPPYDKLWSHAGVMRYRSGARPEPADVFHRVTDIIDRFIDFNRSLAPQRVMAEMQACYVLASYFLDAFNVIGFMWPNGDRGCGKTQDLIVLAELGYLGAVILAGGSYASLRDLADYGALLAFDDAENLSNPKLTDPDKRALLLAGNRRGNTVTIKELAGDKTWRTRHVNTFCPRLFSATRLPDEILASRTIVVPLIRTTDRYRANADPLEYNLWPHDRRGLLDDLWALGLAHLAELPAYEAQANALAQLTGRNLEPWRAILAVALWLDDHGTEGLFERLDALSVAYQTERTDLEIGDLTVLVIRALCRYAVCAVSAVNVETLDASFSFGTNAITKFTKEVAEETEADMDPESITARRVGRVLGKMRLRPERTNKAKGWKMTVGDLLNWLTAYGIEPPEEFAELQMAHPSINGTNGTTARPEPPAEIEPLEEFAQTQTAPPLLTALTALTAQRHGLSRSPNPSARSSTYDHDFDRPAGHAGGARDHLCRGGGPPADRCAGRRAHARAARGDGRAQAGASAHGARRVAHWGSKLACPPPYPAGRPGRLPGAAQPGRGRRDRVSRRKNLSTDAQPAK